MPNFEERPRMDKTDMEISSLFSVVSGHVKGRDAEKVFGYDYHPAVSQPLSALTRVLQMRHGLSKGQVFQRITVASELAVVVQEHVEPFLPEDPDLIYN